MTPKEKAVELTNELFERSLAYHDACIAAEYLVEQIISSYEQIPKHCQPDKQIIEDTINFWKDVELELEKL